MRARDEGPEGAIPCEAGGDEVRGSVRVRVRVRLRLRATARLRARARVGARHS